jgi:hypothetical protein
MKTMKMLLIGFATLLFPFKGFAQSSTVPWSAFDMGFVVSSSPTTTLQSAVGQGFVGTTLGTNTIIYSGFLADPLFSGVVTSIAEEGEIPKEYALSQNYPNPFNPTTTIESALPHTSHVSLKVYNLLGQEVLTLVDEEKSAGVYRVQFNAMELASGLYVYRMRAGEYVATKKLMVLK